MRIANVTNGLAFLPYDAVSMFMSTHGHHASMGYFRIDAMPYNAVIHLLTGGTITLVDATQHNKPLTDAFKFGVPTWCMVFNRAIRVETKVCEWQTPTMCSVSRSQIHKRLVQRIRRLACIFPPSAPAIIGKNVLLEVHRQFPYDDKPNKIKQIMYNM